MELLFLVLIFGMVFYYNNRIGKAEARIDELEANRAGVSPLQTVSTSAAAPLAAPRPAPAPAPAPQAYVAASAPSTPAQPAAPVESQEEKGARWLGRIGALAVLLGVVFFLKYAFDSGLIGETGRVAIGVIFGLIMVGVGQKLRTKYLHYSDILIACGAGVLYLSIYASYGFYHLVASSVALALMALITFFVLVLAVVDGSMGLAVFATLGGFATPVFLSTGENHLVGLSLYMLILDLGVLGAAFYKKWLRLNVLSFIGTIFLFSGWMNSYYTEAQIGTTLLFASIFFFVFLITSVLHHLVRKEKTTLLDLALITVNAAWYFGLSYQLLHPHYSEYLGFFALLLALLYLALAYVSFTSNQADRTLNLFLPGIAVVFLTLAIPLQLSGYSIAIAWLAEAVVLLATAFYLKERVLQVFAWLVLATGVARAMYDVGQIHNSTLATPFWNVGFFLMCIVMLACYLFAALYHRFRDSEPEAAHILLLSLVLGSLATAGMFTVELGRSFENWTPLPWLLEGLLVLFIGIRLRSGVTQAVGWLFTTFGVFAMLSAVSNVHAEHMLNGVAQDSPAFFNLGTLMMVLSVATIYLFAAMYKKYKDSIPDWKKHAAILVVIANILTIMLMTLEIGYYYELKSRALYRAAELTAAADNNYYGGSQYGLQNGIRISQPSPTVDYGAIRDIESAKESAVTVFWAVYAILLLVIGFAVRSRALRLFGLIFFFLTAGRVFLIVWQLGALARIVSSMVFGLIALAASFLYAKYKNRLKEIILD